MIWDLYASPEIKSAEQLRGKIVGTERPGSRGIRHVAALVN